MLTAGVRHLPVLEEHELIGMVGARDAVRSLTRTVLSELAGPQATFGASEMERELSHLGRVGAPAWAAPV